VESGASYFAARRKAARDCGGRSVNAAIDIAKDEMLQQLRKSKGRHLALARRVGVRIKKWTRLGRE